MTVSRSKKCRQANGSSIAEFGAAFYAFCLVIMIPTINILSFAVSFSYAYFAANMTADTVAQSMSQKRAEHVLAESSAKLSSDSLARFLKVTPAATPYKLDLVETNMHGESTVVPVEKLNSRDGEENKSLLQYRVSTNYTLKPLLELGSVPIIGAVPIVAKETGITFQLIRDVEH